MTATASNAGVKASASQNCQANTVPKQSAAKAFTAAAGSFRRQELLTGAKRELILLYDSQAAPAFWGKPGQTVDAARQFSCKRATVDGIHWDHQKPLHMH